MDHLLEVIISISVGNVFENQRRNLDIQLTLNKQQVRVQGPLGELTRDFSHAPISLIHKNNKVTIEVMWPDKRTAATVGTIYSHIQNMIKGVTHGFTVKMKIVFAHFPMSVKIQENQVIIENFFGERQPRRASIFGDVQIKVEEDDVIIQGINLEAVTQTAANIQQATRIKKKDPRVFLDGIYVYERNEGMQ
jgi:large subunit ribosomal protein L6